MKEELTGFQQEGKTLDEVLETAQTEQEETENSSESSTEENQVEEAASSEAADSQESKESDEDKPFHKHPRWREVYAKAQKVDELERRLQELAEKPEPKPQEPPVSYAPKWFRDAYGDNQEAWADYQKTQEQTIQKAVAEAQQRTLSKIEEQKKAEQEAVAKADAWIQGELDALKDEGAKFDQNKLLKIVSDYRPVDVNGLWNIRKAYEIYQIMDRKDAEKTGAKKRLAASTVSTGASDSSDDEVMTPSKIRKMGGFHGIRSGLN